MAMTYQGQAGNYRNLGGGLVAVSGSASHGVPSGEKLLDTGYAMRKMQQDEAEKDRKLRLQMQQNELAPVNARLSWVQSLLPGLMGSFSQVGGQARPQPDFTPSPVYTDQQMQQQVNAARGMNDARTATQQRLMSQQFAGRGIGAFSPAQQAMSRSLAMGNMRANAEAEREIPFQAAQANADSMFRGNQLQQQMWKDYEDMDIARRQNQLTGITSLLRLLG